MPTTGKSVSDDIAREGNCMCMIYGDRMVFLSARRVIYFKLPVHIVDNRSETLSLARGNEDE